MKLLNEWNSHFTTTADEYSSTSGTQWKLHCLFTSLSLTLTGRANNSKPFTMNFQVWTLYILQSITDTNQQQPHLAGTRRKNWKQQYESITDTRVVDMPITHTHPWWPNKCLNSSGIGWWSNGSKTYHHSKYIPWPNNQWEKMFFDISNKLYCNYVWA